MKQHRHIIVTGAGTARELVFALIPNLVGASIASSQDNIDFTGYRADRWCCWRKGSSGQVREVDTGRNVGDSAVDRGRRDSGHGDDQHRGQPGEQLDDRQYRMWVMHPTVTHWCGGMRG